MSKDKSSKDQFPEVIPEMKQLHEFVDHFLQSTSLKPLFEQFEQMLQSAFPFPHVSIESVETDNEYIIKGYLPGIKKEQIIIDLFEHYITISVNHMEDLSKLNEEQKVAYKSFSIGNISKTFRLPHPVSDKDLNVSFKNDELTIIIPLKRKRILIDD